MKNSLKQHSKFVLALAKYAEFPMEKIQLNINIQKLIKSNFIKNV